MIATQAAAVSTNPSVDRIRWAPKVSPGKIRRLYEQNALGIVDDELIDDVGLALHARSRSIVLVNAGQVACPRCAAVFKLTRTYRERAKGETAADPSEVAHCPTPGCGWRTTAGDWWNSWRHRELHAGFGLPPIHEFFERYPLATTPRERMLLIDRLIHQFHHNLKAAGPGRKVAVNLIEGSSSQVVALLDSLTYGDQTAPELHATHTAYRQHLAGHGDQSGPASKACVYPNRPVT